MSLNISVNNVQSEYVKKNKKYASKKNRRPTFPVPMDPLLDIN